MAPQYLAQTIVKVGFGLSQYLRQKGPKMILEAWAPNIKSMTTPLTYNKRICFETMKECFSSNVESNIQILKEHLVKKSTTSANNTTRNRGRCISVDLRGTIFL